MFLEVELIKLVRMVYLILATLMHYDCKLTNCNNHVTYCNEECAT